MKRMKWNKTKSLVTIFSLFILLCCALAYYFHQQIYDEENLKSYFTTNLATILKAPVTSPDFIDVSLINNVVTMRNWKIRDLRGKTFVLVPEAIIRFEIPIWKLAAPRITSIEINRAKFFLHRDRKGCCNFLIFKTRQGNPQKPIEIIRDTLKQIGQLFSTQSSVKFQDAWIGLDAPGIFKQRLVIKNINIELTRKAKRKFSLTRKRRLQDSYHIRFAFESRLTGPVLFKGSYNLKDGLYFYSDKTLSLSLSKIFKKIKPLYPHLKIAGKVKVDGLCLEGVSIDSPRLQLSCKIEQKNGLVCWKNKCLNLTNIQTSFAFHKGKWQYFRSSAMFHKALIQIVNASVKENGAIFLLFQLNHLKLSDDLISTIENLSGLSLTRYWKQFRPEGTLQATGFIRRSRWKKWNWNITTQLKKGSVQYEKLKIKNIHLNVQIYPKHLLVKRGGWRIQRTNFTLNPGSRVVFSPLNISNQLIIAFRRFYINKKLLHSIPVMAEVWKFLQPQGFVDGKVIFSGNPLQKLPIIEAKCYRMKVKFVEAPYPVIVTSATLQFKNNSLIVKNVKGKGLDGKISVSVDVQGWPQKAPYKFAYKAHFKVDNAHLDKTAYEMFSLASDPTSWLKDIQTVWDTLQPSGVISVEGDISHPKKSLSLPEYNVLIRPHGASVRYKEFPYPVTDVRGSIIAQNGIVTIAGVTAKNGTGKLKISGTILPVPGAGISLNLLVKGYNVNINKDLCHALGKEYNPIWKDFSPSGQFDVAVQLVKKSIDKLRWSGQVFLRKGAIRYRYFPYRMDHLSGKIDIAPNNIRFHDVRARHEQAQANLSGWIKNNKLALDITAHKIPLDNKLHAALPKEGKKVWAMLRLSGDIDAKIKLRKKIKKLRWSGELSFQKLAGFYRLFPYQLKNLRGKIHLKDDKSIKLSCSTNSTGQMLKITAAIKPEDFDLLVRAKDLPLDQQLFHALSKKQKKIWNTFLPAGTMDMIFHLRRTPSDSKNYIHLQPRGCSIQYKKFPYFISTITTCSQKKTAGIHIYDGKNIEFNNLCASRKKASFQFNGHYYRMDNGEDLFKLKIKAEKLPIDAELRKAIAKTYPKMMNDYHPKGMIKKLNFQLDNYNKDYLRYQLALDGLDASMNKKKFLKQLGGDIRIKGYAYKDRYHASGTIRHGKVQLSKILIDKIDSQIKFFNDYLILYAITGNLYQGALQAALVLDSSPYGAYKGFMSLKHSNLEKLALAFSKKKEKNTISGILSGELFFQGNSYSTETLTGKGRVNLSEGVIWQFPLFLALLDIFSLPSRPAFRHGDIHFSLFNRLVAISSMRFDSSVLSISGKGNIGFDGKLDLSLLTHFTSNLLIRIPLLDKVWDDLRHDIFAIAVKGSLKKPKVNLNLLK